MAPLSNEAPLSKDETDLAIALSACLGKPLPRSKPASMNISPSQASAQSNPSLQQQTDAENTGSKKRGRPRGSKNKPEGPDHGLPQVSKKRGRPNGVKNKKKHKDAHNAYVTEPDGTLTWSQPANIRPIGYMPATNLEREGNDSGFDQTTRGAYANDAPTGTTMTDKGLDDANVAVHPGEASQYPAPRPSYNVYSYGNGPASNSFPPSEPNHSFGNRTFTFGNNSSSNFLPTALPPTAYTSPYYRTGPPGPYMTPMRNTNLPAVTTAHGYDSSVSLSGADYYNTAQPQYNMPIDPDMLEMAAQNVLSYPPAPVVNHSDYDQSLRESVKRRRLAGGFQ